MSMYVAVLLLCVPAALAMLQAPECPSDPHSPTRYFAATTTDTSGETDNRRDVACYDTGRPDEWGDGEECTSAFMNSELNNGFSTISPDGFLAYFSSMLAPECSMVPCTCYTGLECTKEIDTELKTMFHRCRGNGVGEKEPL